MAGIVDKSEPIINLDEISEEVDESVIRTVFSTQCIKVKTALIHKLKKEVIRSKETCNNIIEKNKKLKFEIAHSRKVLDCMLKATDTVTQANIELEKECLIAKHKKIELAERVAAGEQKYKDLWSESIKKYESVPFVKKYLKVKEHLDNLQQKLTQLDNEEKALKDQIKEKTMSCSKLDQQRIVELANYVVNQRPKALQYIKEKSAAIDKIKREIEKIQEQERVKKAAMEAEKRKMQNQAQEQNDDDWISKLYKIPLNLDFDDTYKSKLDKVNKTLEELSKTSKQSTSKPSEETSSVKDIDEEDYSPYFNKPCVLKEGQPQNYAMRKLINIIEDINIDRKSAQTIVNKVSLENLHPVDAISAKGLKKVQDKIPSENEDVQDMVTNNSDYLLIPPAPFMDLPLTVSQEKQKDKEFMPISQPKDTPTSQTLIKNSQEGVCRKRVSFEVHDKLGMDINVEIPEKLAKADPNGSQLNISTVSDDEFGKIKEMIFKKHNLDPTPQFVYAKNDMTAMKKNDGTAAVTSKFFHQDPTTSVEALKNIEKDIEKTSLKTNELQQNRDPNASQNIPESTIQAISGYSMLQHGSQLISDTLNASTMSHMDYDDSDTNFPHCLESSLLLSPKADYTIPETSEQPQKLSHEEAPNFLSGIRKISSQNQQSSGFAFNFGGEEKKTRGGFFNLFQ